MIISTTFEFSSYTWKGAVLPHMPATFVLSSCASGGADPLLHTPESLLDASAEQRAKEAPALPPRISRLRRAAHLIAAPRS